MKISILCALLCMVACGGSFSQLAGGTNKGDGANKGDSTALSGTQAGTTVSGVSLDRLSADLQTKVRTAENSRTRETLTAAIDGLKAAKASALPKAKLDIQKLLNYFNNLRGR